jgi:hypothetical protein
MGASLITSGRVPKTQNTLGLPDEALSGTGVLSIVKLGEPTLEANDAVANGTSSLLMTVFGRNPLAEPQAEIASELPRGPRKATERKAVNVCHYP